MSTLSLIQNDLSLVIPNICERYCNLPADTVAYLRQEDINTITHILEIRTNTLHDVANFYNWIGFSSGWIFSYPWNANFDIVRFWREYNSFKLGAVLLRKFIRDLHDIEKDEKITRNHLTIE